MEPLTGVEPVLLVYKTRVLALDERGRHLHRYSPGFFLFFPRRFFKNVPEKACYGDGFAVFLAILLVGAVVFRVHKFVDNGLLAFNFFALSFGFIFNK